MPKLKLTLDLDLSPERLVEVLQLLHRPQPPEPKRTEEPPPLIAAMKAGVQ